MTRNQKIALGCGGAGCLGLIVVVIAACLIYFLGYRQSYRASRDYEFNVNVSNANSNSDTNSNSDSNDNSSSSNSDSDSSVSMSDDDKHKLFQAASMTGDAELIRRVNVKIGIVDEDYTLGDDYQRFVSEHGSWAFQNLDFIQSIATPEKARAYVNEHIPD